MCLFFRFSGWTPSLDNVIEWRNLSSSPGIESKEAENLQEIQCMLKSLLAGPQVHVQVFLPWKISYWDIKVAKRQTSLSLFHCPVSDSLSHLCVPWLCWWVLRWLPALHWNVCISHMDMLNQNHSRAHWTPVYTWVKEPARPPHKHLHTEGFGWTLETLKAISVLTDLNQKCPFSPK